MSTVLAIDPGSTESGWAIIDTETCVSGPLSVAAVCDNESAAPRWWNTEGPLTHSSDYGREGLGMEPTPDVTQLVTAIGGIGAIHTTTIPGAPWSKARPRFSRNGHTYVRKQDRQAEDATRTFLRSRFSQPFPGNVALVCAFYRPNFQRIDVDNMLKHVCDAANGILWEDDSQATAVLGVVHLDPDAPRTELAVSSHATSLTRGSDALYPCAVCGSPINRVGQKGKLKKTCSRACSMKVRGFPDLEQILCPGCGRRFKRSTTTQKYCSHECYSATIAGRPSPRAKVAHHCWECGTEVKRRDSRCRDCWRANPSRAKGDDQ